MNIIFQLSLALYRENDGLSALSLAFVIMCMAEPTLIYSVGFRLSAASTLGIILFADMVLAPVRRLTSGDAFKGSLFRRAAGKAIFSVGSVIAVSLCAQAAIFPMLLYYFHYIPTYFLLSNIIVVPLLTPVMAFGLLLAAIGALPVIGALPALILDPLLEFIAFTASFIARLPGAVLPMGRMDLFFAAAYIVLLLAMLSFMKKRKAVGAALAALFVLTAAVGGARSYNDSRVPQLCFINVGRGDCALFKLDGGTTVLIDGGKGSAPMDYLSARGIFSLDCAVLTSAEREHISGMISLVDGGFIKTLYIPSEIEYADSLETLLLSAREAGVRVTEYGAGGSVYCGGLILSALDCDGSSVQLLAEYKGKRILFCGDGLMDWVDSDIVKMPSHGSGSYNYYVELHHNAVGRAVVTASGAYAVDKSKSCAVLRDMGIPYNVPALDGTVTFTLGEEITVSTTREKYEK